MWSVPRTLEAGFALGLDGLGASIAQEDVRVVGTGDDARLGDDDDVVPVALQGVAHEGFGRAEAVGDGGVEEGDAEVEGAADGGGGLVVVDGSVAGATHGPAAESEGRDLQVLSLRMSGIAWWGSVAYGCLGKDGGAACERQSAGRFGGTRDRPGRAPPYGGAGPGGRAIWRIFGVRRQRHLGALRRRKCTAGRGSRSARRVAKLGSGRGSRETPGWAS